MMETIVFYSFKGGTGRSLALAQLAMLLKKYDHRVFVLDLDLGAPGQWEKLAPPLKMRLDLQPHWGVVRYLKDHMNRTILETLDTKVVSEDNLNILVAGNAFARGDDYWKDYLNPKFQAFLAADLAAEDSVRRLKDKIAEDYRPDYLLVDAPSGVSRLASMAIQLFADKVVLLSAFHPEGLLGTNFHLTKIQELNAKGTKMPRPYCVVTRLPTYYAKGLGIVTRPAEQFEDIYAAALKAINLNLRGNNRIRNLYTLSSEPQLELHEELPMESDALASSPLIQDYINLFSDLVEALKDPLMMRRSSSQRPRTFMLIEDEGRMINPADNQPNVAFRVDTLVGTFLSIVDALSDGEETARASLILSRAGWTAGDRFGTYLTKHWEESPDLKVANLSVKEKLDEWCEFDSTVGFGRFAAKLWASGTTGEIELENNFLVTGRPPEDRNVCAYMTGYITRVLEAVFPAMSVKVEHGDEDCGQYKKNDPTCIFHFAAEAVDPKTKGSV